MCEISFLFVRLCTHELEASLVAHYPHAWRTDHIEIGIRKTITSTVDVPTPSGKPSIWHRTCTTTGLDLLRSNSYLSVLWWTVLTLQKRIEGLLALVVGWHLLLPVVAAAELSRSKGRRTDQTNSPLGRLRTHLFRVRAGLVNFGRHEVRTLVQTRSPDTTT